LTPHSKGDYYRYLCEIETGEAQVAAGDSARKCYEAGLGIAVKEVRARQPLSLGSV
jgi:hypothetical protein